MVTLAFLWSSSDRTVTTTDTTATPPKVDIPESVGTTLQVDTIALATVGRSESESLISA